MYIQKFELDKLAFSVEFKRVANILLITNYKSNHYMIPIIPNILYKILNTNAEFHLISTDPPGKFLRVFIINLGHNR